MSGWVKEPHWWIVGIAALSAFASIAWRAACADRHLGRLEELIKEVHANVEKLLGRLPPSAVQGSGLIRPIEPGEGIPSTAETRRRASTHTQRLVDEVSDNPDFRDIRCMRSTCRRPAEHGFGLRPGYPEGGLRARSRFQAGSEDPWIRAAGQAACADDSSGPGTVDAKLDRPCTLLKESAFAPGKRPTRTRIPAQVSVGFTARHRYCHDSFDACSRIPDQMLRNDQGGKLRIGMKERWWRELNVTMAVTKRPPPLVSRTRRLRQPESKEIRVN